MINEHYIKLADQLQSIKDSFRGQLTAQQLDAINDASNALDDMAYNGTEDIKIREFAHRISAAGGSMIPYAEFEKIRKEFMGE